MRHNDVEWNYVEPESEKRAPTINEVVDDAQNHVGYAISTLQEAEGLFEKYGARNQVKMTALQKKRFGKILYKCAKQAKELEKLSKEMNQFRRPEPPEPPDSVRDPGQNPD